MEAPRYFDRGKAEDRRIVLTYEQAEQLRGQCYQHFGKSMTANVVQRGYQNYVVRIQKPNHGYLDVRSMPEALQYMKDVWR